MNARKIAGYDCVESPDNSQLSAVFLGKITKGKKFSFNKNTYLKNRIFTACEP
jgi:hypothetical protein